LLVQVLTLRLVSDSEFEVPRAALRERYSSPPVTSSSDNTSALPSQPTTPRLALFSIPSTPPLQPAEPPSTIASTSATSKKGQSHWISLKTLTKNHSNSTITVASTPTSITTTKGKVIYKQNKVSLSCHLQKSSKEHRTYSEVLFEYFLL